MFCVDKEQSLTPSMFYYTYIFTILLEAAWLRHLQHSRQAYLKHWIPAISNIVGLVAHASC